MSTKHKPGARLDQGATRSTVAAVALLAVVAWTGCAAPVAEPPAEGDAAAAARRPSILILDLDTLRADRLGSYGNPRDTSPVIDALAAEGTRFEWAFAQAPTTPPSQTSIFTSLYPSSHGVKTRHDRVPKAVETLAEVLEGSGYATAAFVDGGFMFHGFGLDQGFDVYKDKPGGFERIGPQALSWMRKHADEPFLLLVHTYDVHSPYLPPEPYRSLFLEDLARPPTPGFEPTQAVLDEIRRKSWREPEAARLKENDRQYMIALYDAGVRYADEWVGRFLTELDTLGIADDTIVVVLSDHGEEFQEHGSVLHDKLYTTVARAPLVIRRPGGGTGHVVGGPVELLDVMPTLLDLAAIPAPPQLQGRSLVPYLDAGEPPERPAVSESFFFNGQRAVSRGEQRIIHWIQTYESELYNYRDDLFEQANVASADAEGVEELRRDLRQWKRRVDAQPPPPPERSRITEAVRSRLKALGYIQ